MRSQNWNWEEEGKNSRILNQRREKEENYRSISKFKPRNQRNRIKIQGFPKISTQISNQNSGKLSNLPHITENHHRSPEPRESIASSNGPIQNPNPNIKNCLKNQRNVSKSTTSVNRNKSLRFHHDFSQKNTRDPNGLNLHQQNEGFTLFQR